MKVHKEFRKVLIVQTAFIGDVVLATPLIEKIAHHFPKAYIDFLLKKGNEDLLEDHPKLRKVIIWNKKKKYQELWKLIEQIRRSKYDLIINLQRFFSSGVLVVLSGATYKVGFQKNPLSLFFDHKVSHTIGNDTHEVRRNLSLIEKMTDSQYFAPKLYTTNSNKMRIAKFQHEPYLILAPTSVWFTKQFPFEQWIVFLKSLSFDGQIYFIGAPSDREYCDKLVREAGIGKNLCGLLSLMESVALIEGAVMNYTNDSAPMHLASAVNAPVTAIFCSTIPEFGFGPLSKNSHVVQVQKKLACRPCGVHGKRKCPKGHFKCGRDINITQLIQQIRNT